MKENIQVFDNVLQLIGKTPLIKLNSMTSGFNGEFYAKVEGCLLYTSDAADE